MLSIPLKIVHKTEPIDKIICKKIIQSLDIFKVVDKNYYKIKLFRLIKFIDNFIASYPIDYS